MDNRSKRYVGLQAAITISMLAFGLAVSAIASEVFYLNFSNQVQKDIKLRLRNIADISAIQLNPEELATIVDRTDLENEFYIKYQKELSDIINVNNDVINIYTIRQNKDGIIYFYMDAGDSNYVPDPPGVIPYQQPSDLLMKTFASPSNTVVEKDIYTDEFGSVISAYVPLYKQDGSLESILGVDMNADTVLNAEKDATRNILIYFGLSIPLISLLAWFLGHRFSRPSIALSTVSGQIANMSERGFQIIPTSLAGNSKEAFELIQAFNKISKELNDLIQNLEERVAERTTRLENESALSEKRAKQFEAITRISSDIVSVQNLQELLPLVSEAISQQFGFYHTGIFLIDPSNQYAVLSAANSEGGKKMIKRHHQLKIGEQGIVGYATSTGNPRVALDVGEDSVYFTNPELPDTHSEMALPLKIGGTIIGALDVQSSESNAFSTEDVNVLSALANQVSLAIQNARLFDQSAKLLSEYEAIQHQYVRETWDRLPQEENFAGFRYSAIGTTQIDINEKIRVPENKTYNEITTPITIRGETIGLLSIHIPQHERVSADQMDLIKAVAERVALSAENARLFEETSSRAARERIISDIAAKIGTSFRTENILRTTATELSRLLNDADIFINLQTPNNGDVE